VAAIKRARRTAATAQNASGSSRSHLLIRLCVGGTAGAAGGALPPRQQREQQERWLMLADLAGAAPMPLRGRSDILRRTLPLPPVLSCPALYLAAVGRSCAQAQLANQRGCQAPRKAWTTGAAAATLCRQQARQPGGRGAGR
jgi:hypothetical protein